MKSKIFLVSAMLCLASTRAEAQTTPKLNGIFYVDGVTYTTLNAAFSACNVSPGCHLIIPPGTYSFSTQIAPTVTATIEGSGASNDTTGTQGAHCITQLNWTGGATVPISLSGGAASGSVLRGFCLNEPSGSAPAVYIDIDNGAASVMLDHVIIDLNNSGVAGTVAGIRWGNTASVVNSICRDVAVRDAGPIEFDLLNVVAKWEGYGCRGLSDSTQLNWSIGGSSSLVENFVCHSCSAEQASGAPTAAAEIQIVNAIDAEFDDLYCEPGTNNSDVCLDIPSSGVTRAQGIKIAGSFVSPNATAETAAFHVGFSSADLTVLGFTLNGGGWANPQYCVKNDSFASVTVAGCVSHNTGFQTVSAPTTTAVNFIPAGTTETGRINGLTVANTVVSGTSTLGNTAISSGSCATVVTTAASGTLTTDSIEWAYASAPAIADGLLTVTSYVTAGNVNWKVCNPTASSRTPSGLLVNWRVVR